MVLRAVVAWSLALVVTLAAAVYQRLSGPTYPLRGQVEIGEQRHTFRLPRSHGGEGEAEVALDVPGFEGEAFLLFRRYPTEDPWTRHPMSRLGDRVVAALPHQPPAGKLEYFVELHGARGRLTAPADRSAVIRFKGDVPGHFLLPHVLLMFLAMLLSNRAGIEALTAGPRQLRYSLLTAAALLAGGMVLGPIVQKYAFGALWTGVPFGFDLTDNKTLLVTVCWGLGLWQAWRRRPSARWWVLGAALALLVAYSVPHSVLGSELDYATGEVVTGG